MGLAIHSGRIDSEHRGDGHPLYAEFCVYTIRHSEAIAQFSRSKGPVTLTTGQKRWAGAKQLVSAAGAQDKIVPLLFAPAEDTTYIIAWADLLSVETDSINRFTFDNLRYVSRPLQKTKLRTRDGTKLSIGFIRDYVLCRTPSVSFVDVREYPIRTSRDDDISTPMPSA